MRVVTLLPEQFQVTWINLDPFDPFRNDLLDTTAFQKKFGNSATATRHWAHERNQVLLNDFLTKISDQRQILRQQMLYKMTPLTMSHLIANFSNQLVQLIIVLSQDLLKHPCVCVNIQHSSSPHHPAPAHQGTWMTQHPRWHLLDLH